MTLSSSPFSDDPEPTHAAAGPNMTDFMSTVIARFIQHEEAQKATNEQLAAIVTALAPPTGATASESSSLTQTVYKTGTVKVEPPPRRNTKNDKNWENKEGKKTHLQSNMTPPTEAKVPMMLRPLMIVTQPPKTSNRPTIAASKLSWQARHAV
ncbi:hypothetical protein F2Q68_00010446 [Brassica cretica]|uniref:Uncharacterized protein n=1 Tax=Brassica cretica TaxID=69181 RepID=A0A8S9KPE8_BRACR|nr:hypothetical protein F2Q68_00010446 [Brassica cretica]